MFGFTVHNQKENCHHTIILFSILKESETYFLECGDKIADFAIFQIR